MLASGETTIVNRKVTWKWGVMKYTADGLHATHSYEGDIAAHAKGRMARVKRLAKGPQPGGEGRRRSAPRLRGQ